MNPSLKKRFWEKVSVEPLDQGFGVALDGRRIKTPAKADLRVPVRAAAELIAAEWDAQDGNVDPETMPATRWANAAIDKVTPQRADVVELLAAYGESDLLCYRADSPAELLALQEAAWNPVLDWARTTHNAPLNTTFGVLPVAQPNQSVANLRAALEGYDSFQIAAIHDLICISGSLVLALALAEGALSVDRAWEISRIDEDWQAKLWGLDDEAEENARAKRVSFAFAHRILMLIQ